MIAVFRFNELRCDAHRIAGPPNGYRCEDGEASLSGAYAFSAESRSPEARCFFSLVEEGIYFTDGQCCSGTHRPPRSRVAPIDMPQTSHL